MRRPKLGTFHGTGWLNEGTPLSGTLKVWQERIDISTDLPKPDPAWTFVDTAGHFHARSADSYPTLRSKVVDMPCNGCCGGTCDGEGFSVTEWRCVLCAAQVHPGTIPGPHHESMPGAYEWSVELEGESTPELERLMMTGFGDRLMLRFNASHPEPWTFFGAVGCNGGTISGGGPGGLMASVLLYPAGELGDRPLVKELTK